MDKQGIAQELVRVAKELSGSSMRVAYDPRELGKLARSLKDADKQARALWKSLKSSGNTEAMSKVENIVQALEETMVDLADVEEIVEG